MTATTIDQVIWRLHQICAGAWREQSRLGYFAALYMHVAVRVKHCLAAEVFEHPDFVHDLNIAFFNRYLDALERYRQGEPPPRAWQIAFEAAQSDRASISQLLLLGANAHINLDLGVAMARICSAEQLPHHRADFEHMNGVLLELFEDVERGLAAASPVLGRIHQSFGPAGAAALLLGLRGARQHAWSVAARLAPLPLPEQVAEIQRLDAWVARLALLIWRPGPLPDPLGALVRAGERADVRQTLESLMPEGYSPLRLPAQPDAPPARRERVAVLGGGIAALAAAFELSDPLNNPHHDRYEITVYQIGWRLGGKGASGRSLDPQQFSRIEEHGLHAWFGFYENAFHLIRRCYQELGRPPDMPLARWDDAFKPISVSALITTPGGQERLWPLITPPNSATPGDGGTLLPLRDYLLMGMDLLARLAQGTLFGAGEAAVLPPELAGLLRASGASLDQASVSQLPAAAYTLFRWAGQTHAAEIERFGRQARALLQWLRTSADPALLPMLDDARGLIHAVVLRLLETFMGWLWRRVGQEAARTAAAHHTWLTLNFLYAHLRGALAHDLAVRGLAAINEYDYRDWLATHAFPDGGMLLGSALIASVYDSCFAYDRGRPSMEAGTALGGLIRTFLTYKGALGWKMQAGTGDVIFAPLYEVLRRRGVRFRFFHRVKALRLADDPRRPVAQILLGRQIWLRPDPQGREPDYQPLIDVKGLPCWPSQPLYEQIEGAEALRAAGVNLESPADQTEVEELTLHLGQDFDHVVLGIPVDALPALCGDLIAHSPAWRAMTEQIRTTATQALQLWLRPSASALGCTLPGAPIMTFTYDAAQTPNPLNAWGNLSHLAPREDWPSRHYPLSIAYFCSALAEAPADGPARGCQQAQANQAVYAAAQRLLSRHIGRLWPAAGNDGASFDWRHLIDARSQPGHGPERLEAQYWRANILPAERYVLSVPGSSKHRLPANNPREFPNLYLAGDWTANGLNCGCMEAAVISGRLASLALCGYPQRQTIAGVDFGRPL